MVELKVVDPFVRKGYRFKGHATVLTEGPLFDEVVAFYGRGEAALRDAGGRIRSVVWSGWSGPWRWCRQPTISG